MTANEAGKVASPELYDRACYEAALRERIGDAFDVLSKAKVGVAGLGGLGSNISIFLARCGVGHLELVDFDHVEASNLNRQQYRVSDLGRPKAEALPEILHAINPYVSTSAHDVRVTPKNVREMFGDVDVICEAFDKPEAKSMLVNAVLEQLPDTPLVSGVGMAGCGPANLIRTRHVSKNFWVCGDGQSDVRVVGSLFAPRVATCAGHQALIAVQILLGTAEDM
ncbi:MAG: sulfur carrier protein ThiS adenylyltransferase ThiF, partial [Coriobacteriales bacterium]